VLVVMSVTMAILMRRRLVRPLRDFNLPGRNAGLARVLNLIPRNRAALPSDSDDQGASVVKLDRRVIVLLDADLAAAPGDGCHVRLHRRTLTGNLWKIEVRLPSGRTVPVDPSWMYRALRQVERVFRHGPDRLRIVNATEVPVRRGRPHHPGQTADLTT
jgi:hypothetical protein